MIKQNVLRKNLLTNEIDYGNVDSEFEVENLNGNIIIDYPFIELNTEEYKQYLLQQAKDNKKQELKNNYSNSKINAKFYFQNIEIPFLNGGVDEAIDELQKRVSAGAMIGLDISLTNGKLLLKNALQNRHNIRTNLKTSFNEIDNLQDIQQINNYILSNQITFPENINIEDLLIS